MSDHWTWFVPTDPRFVPEPDAAERARELLARSAPRADEVRVERSQGVRFYDAGTNFEAVRCPSCARDIDLDWWHERMDDDYADDAFALSPHATPCCGAMHSLDRLVYDWPQAFGRFALVAQNADLGRIEPRLQLELERALGTPVVIVYQHL